MNYIAKLIRIGGWFDDTRPFIKTSPETHPNNYAPQYILENREKFKYLLDPPATLATDTETGQKSKKSKKKKDKPEEYDTDLLNEIKESTL